MKGYIFNIQKFSIHDGPGIRTTVFFKGCNLKCSWCANPESQCMQKQLTLDANKCLRCMKCVEVCPAHARKITDGLPHVDAELCSFCGACEAACPVRAIGREGRCVSLNETLEEVMKDKPFYDHSGGGVTFSGGEVLLQQEFAISLAQALRANGVHVAIETAAAVPSEQFKAFLEEIDYAFVDLKHYDSTRHRDGTGVGNEQIIENIRLLVESGKEYCIRIPVIPGYNDSPDDARCFAELLKELGAANVQLLPFHQLGEQKYALLGRDYAWQGKKQLHREDLTAYLGIFKAQGVEARL